MSSILLLSTYPIAQPRHGGQVRTSALAKMYGDNGWEVTSLAVFEAEGYGPGYYGPNDVEFPPSSSYRKFHGRSIPLITDLLTGHFAIAENGGWPDIVRKLPGDLDAIHVEQPWLWPLAVKIKKIPQFANVILIYGSQNIEWPLKKEIFESYNVHDADEVLDEIQSLERGAALEADLTVAVTIADFEVLASWGCKSLILAANGIAPWHATEECMERWKARLPEAPWILYVASAHPPNFQGFNDSLGGSLACIPPDSRLVVVGSVGEHLARVLSEGRWGSLNLSRLELLFILPDEDLAAIKSLAHAFLLPIPHGGGSNIKTAEAIYSGKYVVGSEAAFRGFEKFTDLSGVSIARSPRDFHLAIQKALTSHAPPLLTDLQRAERSELTWDSCLGVIPDEIQKVLRQSVRL